MDKRIVIVGLLISLALAVFLSPFASSWPDGLERVAGDRGFIDLAGVKPLVSSPIPDYAWPGIKNEKLATAAAGLAGTLVLFGLGLGLGHLLKEKR